mmetsp:Transcript_1814/g.4978  ORF Transcript_1814/g.4978 Transcript_1814/m.4978 type:complete len:248 (-) Transcript_1814:1186-1929(-)
MHVDSAAVPGSAPVPKQHRPGVAGFLPGTREPPRNGATSSAAGETSPQRQCCRGVPGRRGVPMRRGVGATTSGTEEAAPAGRPLGDKALAWPAERTCSSRPAAASSWRSQAQRLRLSCAASSSARRFSLCKEASASPMPAPSRKRRLKSMAVCRSGTLGALTFLPFLLPSPRNCTVMVNASSMVGSHSSTCSSSSSVRATPLRAWLRILSCAKPRSHKSAICQSTACVNERVKPVLTLNVSQVTTTL